MSKHRILAGLIPAFALAACSMSDGVTAETSPLDPTESAITVARGQSLVRDMCASCHGTDLEGTMLESVACPSLRVAKHLSSGQFELLLLEGKDPAGNYVDHLMEVTRTLPIDDVHAVHAYLRAWNQF